MGGASGASNKGVSLELTLSIEKSLHVAGVRLTSVQNGFTSTDNLRDILRGLEEKKRVEVK